jgi:hypothetical protein
VLHVSASPAAADVAIQHALEGLPEAAEGHLVEEVEEHRGAVQGVRGPALVTPEGEAEGPAEVGVGPEENAPPGGRARVGEERQRGEGAEADAEEPRRVAQGSERVEGSARVAHQLGSEAEPSEVRQQRAQDPDPAGGEGPR